MRKTKYNVGDKSKRTYDGIIFDSALEMKYYVEVVVPEFQAGIITSFELQKKYMLQEPYIRKLDSKKIMGIDYVADFYIVYNDNSECVVDTKGMADSVAKLKRKLFEYKYPDINYSWISYSKIDGGWIEYEELQKHRRERKKK